MQLLTIKCGSDYLRITNGTCHAVGLDKASVYPLDQLARMHDRLAQARANGFAQAALYRLHLTEAPFEEGL